MTSSIKIALHFVPISRKCPAPSEIVDLLEVEQENLLDKVASSPLSLLPKMLYRFVAFDSGSGQEVAGSGFLSRCRYWSEAKMSKHKKARHTSAKMQPRGILTSMSKTLSRAELVQHALKGAAFTAGSGIMAWVIAEWPAFLRFLAVLHIALALWLTGAPALPNSDYGAIRLALDRDGGVLKIAVIGFLLGLAARLRATANKLKLGLTLGSGGIAYA